MVIGDGTYIKKVNRSIIIENIIKYNEVSRANLSKITGLNKATISAQVSELIDEKLIDESETTYHSVGRRPIMLSINQGAGYVLGIDLDYGEILFTVANIAGHVVEELTVTLIADSYEEIVSIIIERIKIFKEKYSHTPFGLTSATIGVHGMVNNEELIYFIPKYQWSQKQLKRDIQEELNIDIQIENNANLSAYGEQVYKFPKSDNLLNITVSSGIGAGVVIDGKIYKGYMGFGGEIGHMVINPDGNTCKCGNKGCLEQYASETSFFNRVKELLPDRDLTKRIIIQMLKDKNPATLEAMEDFIPYLTLGLNNIINMHNPETIVINSEILNHYPQAIEEIEAGLTSRVSLYGSIVLSSFGDYSCVFGACAYSLKKFWQVPTLELTGVKAKQLLQR